MARLELKYDVLITKTTILTYYVQVPHAVIALGCKKLWKPRSREWKLKVVCPSTKPGFEWIRKLQKSDSLFDREAPE